MYLNAQKGRFNMSQDTNFLKNTMDLLETDPEIKSYIYQQIHEFTPYITPETLVMVIARNPTDSSSSLAITDADTEVANTEDLDLNLDSQESDEDTYEHNLDTENYKYRIAIILKESDSTIEAEAFHNDIFEAIKMAKEKLLAHLIEIRNEVESPQDRIKAIKEASDNKQIH